MQREAMESSIIGPNNVTSQLSTLLTYAPRSRSVAEKGTEKLHTFHMCMFGFQIRFILFLILAKPDIPVQLEMGKAAMQCYTLL